MFEYIITILTGRSINYINNGNPNQGIAYNYFPPELKELYEDKIKLLEEKIKWLESVK